ncbi:hypothetical protein Tco_0654412 [Tanacetum coccineum]|uniref:Uncharacterized protein n=1 Tax=Tanacetum coccineum TaxID=301880 RepID=A0ABQ4X3I6_9ASTR
MPGPESIQNQESEKSPKEIIRIKREQGEEKQDSTYSIRSTDKVDLEEFDLKSALFKHMNKNKSANRNPANYHLYHALMEALIADEDAMDKEVAVKVKDHKRKHDSDDDEDDDDDEGPSAGSNQGRSTKRRRPDSAASGSAQPPPKDDDQSSKKPRESDASASKQHPALASTGWQITDTRDAGVDSSMHRSDPESEHSEQSSDDIPMQDEGNDSDMEDTDNADIPKVSTTTRTGKKKLCKADLEGPAFNIVKTFHKNNVFLQYQMDECHKLLTNKRSLLHDNIVPKPDLALELGKSISLTEAEEVVAREVHATHARIVSESEPESTQRRQSGIAFRDSFIVSKKRSSDSSKKLKGIQTLTPAEQEAADIMKALKERKKISKRQPGTGGYDILKMEMEMEIRSTSDKVSMLPQTLISCISSQVHKMAIHYKMM